MISKGAGFGLCRDQNLQKCYCLIGLLNHFRAVTHCLSRCNYQSPSKHHYSVKPSNRGASEIPDILAATGGGHLR